jgi:hypothetical protein
MSLSVYSLPTLLDTMPSPPNKKASIDARLQASPPPPPTVTKNKKKVVTPTVCDTCKECFLPSRKSQLYCSNSCRVKAFRLAKKQAKKSNGLGCIRCNEPLTGRQKKFCGNTCRQLAFRAKKRATVHKYQQLGIKLDTVLDSIELIGMSKSTQALQQLGYTYSIADKSWQGGK